MTSRRRCFNPGVAWVVTDRVRTLQVCIDIQQSRRNDAVNAFGEYLLHPIIDQRNGLRRHDDDIAVTKPYFIRWRRSFSVDRTIEVQHRRDKSPIIGSSKNNDLTHVRADKLPASRRDGRKDRGRYRQLDPTGRLDLA